MNAWIDCLYYADEDDGMRNIVVAPDDVLTLQLLEATSFAERCPEQYAAIVECSAFVNWSRIHDGARPIIAPSRSPMRARHPGSSDGDAACASVRE